MITSSPELHVGKIRYSVGSKWWVVADCCPGLLDYCLWWVDRIHHVKLMRPKWGSHISIIKDEEPLPEFHKHWKFNDGEQIEFQIGRILMKTQHYYWFPVYCDQLQETRDKFGLGLPDVCFHLTIGREE